MPHIALIVGLGNPGKDYAETRHNAGQWWLQTLATKLNVSFRSERRFKAQIAQTNIEGQGCLLLMPETFMNLSGQVLSSVTHFYKISAEQILIAHDELDFLPGIIRLKKGGGHGGHNGLRDIMSHLSSQDFYRLRIGIGHPGHAKEVVNYVLGRPSLNERIEIDRAMEKAVDLAPLMVGEIDKAMNQLNSLN